MMGEKRKDRKIHITSSQVGIVGDNARIHGDVHFHHHPNVPDDAEKPEYTEPSDEGTAFDLSTAANILHLSDLHFVAGKDSKPIDDANRWYAQLTDDLIIELECEKLDAAIISGDIGNFSEPDEYLAAEIFLERLCARFSLDASRLIIVPGNHDLNWKLSKKGYRLMDVEDYHNPLEEAQFIRVSKDVIRLRDDNYWHNNYKGVSSDGSAWLDLDREERGGRVFRGGAWDSSAEICRDPPYRATPVSRFSACSPSRSAW